MHPFYVQLLILDGLCSMCSPVPSEAGSDTHKHLLQLLLRRALHLCATPYSFRWPLAHMQSTFSCCRSLSCDVRKRVKGLWSRRAYNGPGNNAGRCLEVLSPHPLHASPTPFPRCWFRHPQGAASAAGAGRRPVPHLLIPVLLQGVGQGDRAPAERQGGHLSAPMPRGPPNGGDEAAATQLHCDGDYGLAAQ